MSEADLARAKAAGMKYYCQGCKQSFSRLGKKTAMDFSEFDATTWVPSPEMFACPHCEEQNLWWEI